MRHLLPLLLLASCSGQPAIAPGKIVSNNPCIDAVLAEIAAPGQIGAVSAWSHQADSASAALAWARQFPALGSSAEELIAARPALALTGNIAFSSGDKALDRASVPHRSFGVPASIADSIAQVQSIAVAINRKTEGEALAKRIANAATQQPSRGQSAIIWQASGFVPGAGTLQDEMLSRAGFRNASAAYGLKQWDWLPLETMLRSPPGVVFMPQSSSGESGRALAMRQRLTRHLAGRVTFVPFPERLLNCGGPSIVEAMSVLTQKQSSPQ
jgi:iron complex transport system substrate-binding protein